MDFYRITTRPGRNGSIEIIPDFVVSKSSDLMVRGKSFYAVYDESTGFWSTDEYSVIRAIDNSIDEVAEKYRGGSVYDKVIPRYMKNYSSNSYKNWKDYLSRLSDNFIQLDTKPTFQGYKPKKEDYVSRQLDYSLSDAEPKCWNKLVGYLYDEEERKKIEWSIGAIATGDSTKIQKFVVFFGAPGTGKSTILDIVQRLFKGYWSPFDSKSLGSIRADFALEAFKSNPLVGIEHEGDLSRVTDNSKLNSVVSHEVILVNEKNKPHYPLTINTFLMMGTNMPVKITDAKAGTMRRLIDIHPTGNTLPEDEYDKLMNGINYELGAIVNRCINVYKSMGKGYYRKYIPLDMVKRTDPFFNFVEENYDYFASVSYETLKHAFAMYKDYMSKYDSDDKPKMYVFRDNLKDYFDDFKEDCFVEEDGKKLHLRKVYFGFKKDKFKDNFKGEPVKQQNTNWLEFGENHSVLDDICSDCLAQYSNKHGTPSKPWKDVETTLKQIDTTKEHYLQVPLNIIVIDFDIKDENGEKSLELNMAEAMKWPKTYAELSKSGKGIHLHYYYDGDPTLLSRTYADAIEVKVFTGNSALRRKLTLCNDVAISTISSGLALKKKSGKTMDEKVLQDERHLRRCIIKALKREVWPNTKPSIDYISFVLEEAYNSGIHYNVEDMKNDILAFAFSSTNQGEYCIAAVKNMKFKSEDCSPPDEAGDDDPIMFFDVEVYSNLFIFCYKKRGSKTVNKLINPTTEDMVKLIFKGNKKRWVGFNNRRYDNHIVWAKCLGYTNEMLYDISQRIVNNGNVDRNCYFGEAYNLSWADIYDYTDVKQSLKKWEIALQRAKELNSCGYTPKRIFEETDVMIPSSEWIEELKIHHEEMDWDWNKPIPENLWEKAAEYCCNDVNATEAVFEVTQTDLKIRQILAELSGLTVNDPSRLHTTKIIFGDNKKPDLVYTDLSETFPGYKYEMGKSSYRGEDPSEGGYVFAVPGMYGYTPVFDVASMHPSSIIALNLFGEYTVNFEMLKDIRILIKHKEFDKVAQMFDGKLAKYVQNEDEAKQLSKALKLVINSVYGYTTAKFANPFKDPRNIDNIVAKRGALFMIDLKHIVQDELGFPVAHIKTDSIKIPGATKEVEDRVVAEGKKYGYNFEIEEVFEKLCLVNDAVFVGKEKDTGNWITTGAQFQVPYVKKTLFTHEPLIFDDFCVTRAVKTAMYVEFTKEDGTIERQFVGKVGRFCPMKTKGGRLVCSRGDDKFNSVQDSKDWLWLESSMVKELGYEDDIDYGYFERKAQEAIDTISQFGDFNEFVA